MPTTVLLFYKYVTIADPRAFADLFRVRAAQFGLTGRALIAEEGLNATLEGTPEVATNFLLWLRSDARFADLKVKTSDGDGTTFPKLLVKVRKEIVGTRFSQAEADPRVRTAPHLAPEALKKMYDDKEAFVVVDMRNSYEFASGHFKGSIDPGLRSSRDLEKAIAKLAPYKDKKVVTVCTGGIRCEKMSAYLLNKGFTDVHQLEDGIHAYMEKYPGKDFLGTLYTFDERVTMDFDGEREIVGSCKLCSQKTERYVNCQYDDCHLHMLACTGCAPDEKQAFCSTACRRKNALVQLARSFKRRYFPSRERLMQLRRRMLKRYHRSLWKVRRLRLGA